MAVRIPKLRQRVTVQKRSVTASAESDDEWGESGDAAVTWTDCATKRANVTPMHGREMVEHGGVQGEIGYRVQMRYDKSITQEHRLKYCDKVLDIVSLIDVEARRRLLELVCKEHRENG